MGPLKTYRQNPKQTEPCSFSIFWFLSEDILIIWITIVKNLELEPVLKKKVASLFLGTKSQQHISPQPVDNIV